MITPCLVPQQDVASRTSAHVRRAAAHSTARLVPPLPTPCAACATSPHEGCRDQFHTRIRHGEPVRMPAYWPRIFANLCVFHRGSVYMPAYSCVFVRTCSRTSAYLPRIWRPNRVFPRTCANFAYSRIRRISAYIHVYPRCIRRISMYTGPRIVRVFAVYSPRTYAKYTRIRV